MNPKMISFDITKKIIRFFLTKLNSYTQQIHSKLFLTITITMTRNIKKYNKVITCSAKWVFGMERNTGG
jgi:hypothetical protein